MNSDTAYAVLLTDREKLGAAIRLLAEDGTPTLRPGRALLFKREQAARAWLDRNYVDPRVCYSADRRHKEPRYLYTVAEVVVPPRRPKPARQRVPLLPLVWE